MQNIQLLHMRWCYYRTVKKEAFWDMTMCLWVSSSWHPKDCNALILMWSQPMMTKATHTPKYQEPLTHPHSIKSKKIRICTYASSWMVNSRKTSGISQKKFLNILEWQFKLTLGQLCLCLLMLVQNDSSNSVCKFHFLCCDFHKRICGWTDHQTSFLSFLQYPTSFLSCIFHVHSSNLVTEEY